jgi:hypothetical protein
MHRAETTTRLVCDGRTGASLPYDAADGFVRCPQDPSARRGACEPATGGVNLAERPPAVIPPGRSSAS